VKNFPTVSEGLGPRESVSIKQEPGPRAAMLWLLTCCLALMAAIAVALEMAVEVVPSRFSASLANLFLSKDASAAA